MNLKFSKDKMEINNQSNSAIKLIKARLSLSNL